MLSVPGFHHLHLNSVDPEAAIAFYTRQFPTTAKASWGGLPALAVAEQRPDPVHPGGHPAADVAADRDLAFRLACHRHARAPRRVPEPAGRHAGAALHQG